MGALELTFNQWRTCHRQAFYYNNDGQGRTHWRRRETETGTQEQDDMLVPWNMIRWVCSVGRYGKRTSDIHWCIQRMDIGCAGLWESPTTIYNLILSNIRMTGTVMMMIKWTSVLSTTRRRLMSVQWIRFIGPVDGTWPQCVSKEVDTITRKTSSPNPTSIYLGRRLWCYDEGRTLMTGYVSNLSFLLYWILTQIF